MVRVDGLHSGAEFDVSGAGAGGVNIDNGASHSLAVTVDRIRLTRAKIVLIKFTPLGPAHAIYKLQASTVSDSIPDSDRSTATDASARLTQGRLEPVGHRRERCPAHGGRSGNGDISYALAFAPGAATRDPAVTRTSGGVESPRLAAAARYGTADARRRSRAPRTAS